MKKLILVIFCAIIMTVFIALNYLLWDRENNMRDLQYLNASKNASINAYSREMDINSQLMNRIGDLEDDNKRLQLKSNQLESDVQKLKESVDQKNESLNKLKQIADIKVFNDIIDKWAAHINEGQYAEAYDLQRKQASAQDKVISENEFAAAYKNAVKGMKLVSVKLLTEGVADDRKGDLTFRVELDVKKGDNDTKNLFVEGLNIRNFTFTPDKDKNDWVISDITPAK